jgi:hypothetical protein
VDQLLTFAPIGSRPNPTLIPILLLKNSNEKANQADQSVGKGVDVHCGENKLLDSPTAVKSIVRLKWQATRFRYTVHHTISITSTPTPEQRKPTAEQRLEVTLCRHGTSKHGKPLLPFSTSRLKCRTGHGTYSGSWSWCSPSYKSVAGSLKTPCTAMQQIVHLSFMARWHSAQAKSSPTEEFLPKIRASRRRGITDLLRHELDRPNDSTASVHEPRLGKPQHFARRHPLSLLPLVVSGLYLPQSGSWSHANDVDHSDRAGCDVLKRNDVRELC